MPQQIKNNIKNEIKDIPISIAFQAKIFKYIQKKRRQLSIFEVLSKKYPSKDEMIIVKKSNLIVKNYMKDQKLKRMEQIKEEQAVRKNESLQNLFGQLDVGVKANNFHKKNLSDWRILYQQRDGIEERIKMRSSKPDQMNVTERLFYPLKKEQMPIIDRKPLHTIDAIKQNSNKKYSTTVSNFRSKSTNKYFVSNQNFIQMYHRSYSPIVMDYHEKKKITQYLSQNQSRHQLINGLRQMNEEILNQQANKKEDFLPYRNLQKFDYCNEEQQTRREHQNQQKILKQIQRSKKPNKKTIKLSEQIDKTKMISFETHFYNQNPSKQDQNPQTPVLNSKLQNPKGTINLSQMFDYALLQQVNQNQTNDQIKLKLFKQRRNKIENGIFSTKKVSSFQKPFANFKHSRAKSLFRNTFMN